MLVVWYYFLLLYEYVRMREAVVTHSYCCNTAVLDLHRSTSCKLPVASSVCLTQHSSNRSTGWLTRYSLKITRNTTTEHVKKKENG